MSARTPLRARPGLRLLCPGEPDTLWADDHGVGWLAGGVLGWIGGWTPEAPRFLLGALPPGALTRVGAGLAWVSDAGDEALHVNPDGGLRALRWPRPHGPSWPAPFGIAAPGAFSARLLPWPGAEADRDALRRSAPEVAWEGRCLPWPCGGGHTVIHEQTVLRRRIGGPTRVLAELPAAPSWQAVGPGGALVVLVGGACLGAAAGGALIALPDGLDLGELRFSPDGQRALCLDEDNLVDINLVDGEPAGDPAEGWRPAGWRGSTPLAWEPRTGALAAMGGPALALGFGAAPPRIWGQRLFGPGGFTWDLTRGAPTQALVELDGGLALDQIEDAAPLGPDLLLLLRDGLRRLHPGGRLGPPLPLPRRAGAPLALAGLPDRVAVLCDRDVLQVTLDGVVQTGGPTAAFDGMEQGRSRSGRWTTPDPGGQAEGPAAWWTASGLAVHADGPRSPEEDEAIALIF
ncbi:MAG: hypothetical protein JNM72_09795 [Deltaproteobacteria bacterium]|nr:hypothetical protein [Deltaproteobacteria bacterium]